MTRFAVFPTYMVPSAYPAVLAEFDMTPERFSALEPYLKTDLCRMLREAGLPHDKVLRATGLDDYEFAQIAGERHFHGLDLDDLTRLDQPDGAQEKRATPSMASRAAELLAVFASDECVNGLTRLDIEARFSWSLQACKSTLGHLYERDLIERIPQRTPGIVVVWTVTGKGRELAEQRSACNV